MPKKNIRPLAGKPLIAYAIETALQAPSLGSVIVSTDDEEIAEVARNFGARVPFLRPRDLASDTAPEWQAWQHALEWVESQDGPIDAMVSIPTTSPFRDVEDVESCISMLQGTPTADAVITVKKGERNPYFNMVTVDRENVAALAIPSPSEVARRQDAPEVLDITTVAYAVRPHYVRNSEGLFDGKVVAVEVPQERALDIDTPYDFWLAELIAASSVGPDGRRRH